MTLFQWFSIIFIFGAGALGGYYPLLKQDSTRKAKELPAGESFTAGVFLALSLTIMLPAGFHLFKVSFPHADFPFATIIAIGAFLGLLAIEHAVTHIKEQHGDYQGINVDKIVPVIMTVMIAIPSFLLGTALGVSQTFAAVFIFVAIVAHKASAGFGLALIIAKSSFSRMQGIFIYSMFMISTPIGILVGADMQEYLRGETIIVVKAIVLSLAAGVFLYMAVLHGLRHTPLLVFCCEKKRFGLMLLGLIITALIRLILGLGHAG